VASSRALTVRAACLPSCVPRRTVAGPAAARGGEPFTVDVASVINLNPTAETVTLSLLQGSHNGQPVYYVVTDDSSEAAARRAV